MAKRERRREDTGERFKWFQIEILVVFAAIILIVTAFLDYVILERSGSALQQSVSNLIAANSRQLELNINSYLERMETTSTLLFSDEAYYLYDPTDEGIEDYDKVKSEENIKDRIVDIGLMENYSDFGIIYSDDHKVGWISHGTQDLFPEGGIYDAFASYIINPRKNDGWCFGINGSVDRMYYVKRLNPNAILVSAIYTKELSSVFIYPEQLEDMTVRLVDENDNIMFSTENGEIGQKLPGEIADELSSSVNNERDDQEAASSVNNEKDDQEAASSVNNEKDDQEVTSSSIISDDYMINSNTCSNNWRVICSVPTKSVLQENIKLRSFTLKISIAMAASFVLIGLLLITKLSRPMDGMVSSLKEKAEIDRLSGVMNKVTFQETVENKLAESIENRVSVFVMLDMDNFKRVNDMLGHTYGDQVIIRVGKLLRRLYDTETIIGRLGGDEFALFTECIDVDREGVVDAVTEQMNQVLEAFSTEFEHERELCGVSISAGVYVTAESDMIKFKEIYDKADKALYKSKQAGKSRYTFYGI